jgi:hypothetical protein
MDKAVKSGDPEKAIGSLIDATDNVLRQAAICRPHIVPVLRAGGKVGAEEN